MDKDQMVVVVVADERALKMWAPDGRWCDIRLRQTLLVGDGDGSDEVAADGAETAYSALFA